MQRTITRTLDRTQDLGVSVRRVAGTAASVLDPPLSATLSEGETIARMTVIATAIPIASLLFLIPSNTKDHKIRVTEKAIKIGRMREMRRSECWAIVIRESLGGADVSVELPEREPYHVHAAYPLWIASVLEGEGISIRFEEGKG